MLRAGLAVGAAFVAALTTAPAALAAQLEVSTSPTRSPSVVLNGAPISGDRYVHLTGGPASGPVTFYLDGAQARSETNAPFDFAGGTASAAAPWSTTSVADGQHRMEARWSGGSATATFTVANTTAPPPPPPPSGAQLVVSSSADRSGATTLAGATLSGSRYVYVKDPPAGASVVFHLDGALLRNEGSAPLDFAGTASGGGANPWATTTVSNAQHTIEARLSTGATLTATFTVANSTTTPPPPSSNTITRSGAALLLNGQPFKLWGIRVASATQDQAQTDHLIAQLDAYRAHGVNTVAVFYQAARARRTTRSAATG